MRTVASIAAGLALVVGCAMPALAQRTMSAEEQARQERELQEMMADPRPIEAANSVWIDELTWMEVRDALTDGVTTAIIPTGGVEQNGPYLTTGKHNVVLRGACESLAQRLGDALCSPVVAFVPEGDIEPKSGHMRFPGTISLRQETYRLLLDDIASSLRAHGFDEIIFIGDSGGNQAGMEEVAQELNARWSGSGAVAYYIPEFYDYAAVEAYMHDELGVVEPVDDGHHDNLYITSLMMVTDAASVRYEERVAAGLASINGVSIAPKEETIELGRKLMGYRTELTVRAIEEARALVSADRE